MTREGGRLPPPLQQLRGQVCVRVYDREDEGDANGQKVSNGDTWVRQVKGALCTITVAFNRCETVSKLKLK